ncbi:MAG: SBBP repeat-containing protein [Thermoplasmata archaeon]|nr:MAG: SBBP repeat-containing protein [Thermoplasmata archaeon]
MQKQFWTVITVIILAFNFITISSSATASHLESSQIQSEPAFNKMNEEDINSIFTNPPGAFTANFGQLGNSEVRFYDVGGSVWFTDEGVWFRGEGGEGKGERSIVFKQEFVGANPIIPEGREPLDYYSNFFYGNDPARWCTEVPNYQEVFYEEIYDGIDLRYYTYKNQLKYDLLTHPGADLSQIAVRYDGTLGLESVDHNNLKINTKHGTITDGDLFIYQDYGSKRHEIEGEFVLLNENKFGYKITGDYNRRELLVIDPVIKYSTFMGGTGWGTGNKIARDPDNNIYITGFSGSDDFPTTPDAYNRKVNGNNDLIVFKMYPTCSNLVYSTFIGGLDTEEGYGIDVDSSGNAYVTGFTRSDNFPVTPGAYDIFNNGTTTNTDTFILKLNPFGTGIVYSTLIEGDDIDRAFDIAVDSSGNAIISGYTRSNNFPTKNAYDSSFDGDGDFFVVKLNSFGSDLIFSTYIGGDGSEHSYCIALDNNDDIYIGGRSSSSDFPVSSNAYKKTITGVSDIFVLKFSKSGNSVIYATFISSSHDHEDPKDIYVDDDGCAYLTGDTGSPDFPVTPGAFNCSNITFNTRNVFVAKFNSDGSNLIFSSLIGDNADDMPRSIQVDSNKNVFVAGTTASVNFPTTSDALYKPTKYNYNAFLFQLSKDGTKLFYSTFIGGSKPDYGAGMVLDSNEEPYVMGSTNSTDFPVTPGAYDTSINTTYKIFIMNICFKPFAAVNSTTLDQGKMTMTAYAQSGSYNFRVNVYNTGSADNLVSVKLTLDPTGSAVDLLCRRSDETFKEVSDPYDYVSIHPSSRIVYKNNYWEIDFNVTFNWHYPDEGYHSVGAFVTTGSLPQFYAISQAIYHVENDLVFQGDLRVKDDDGNIIQENDLVGAGQDLTFWGLKAVYEGTTGIHPQKDSYRISVWDELGTCWHDSPGVGVPCSIKVTAPEITYSYGHTFTINITEIPRYCDKTSQNFIVRIDAGNVTFANPSPDDTTWQLDTKVSTSIEIADVGGGFVNDTSIMFSTSTNNGSAWMGWRSPESILINWDKSVTATTEIELEQGKNNLIKWRAKDTVGNGPFESNEFRILVDSEPVIFSDAMPEDTDVALTQTAEVGITISDHISGVCASTIAYSTSTDSGNTWNQWKSPGYYQDGPLIKILMNLTFPEGNTNRIKWRAGDVAGNEIVESPAITIYVRSWGHLEYPAVNLITPPSGAVFNTNQVMLRWELLTPKISYVTYDVYFGRTNPPALHKEDFGDISYNLDELEYNVTYYWTIIPKTGNQEGICISGIWEFTVETPSEPQVDFFTTIKIEGPDSIQLYQGDSKSIDLTISNIGSEYELIEITISGTNLANHVFLEDASLLDLEANGSAKKTLIVNIPDNFGAGEYNIFVSAKAVMNNSKIMASHTIKVQVQEKETESPGFFKEKGISNLVIAIIIVIIVILIVLFFVFKSKYGRRILPGGRAASGETGPSAGPPAHRAQPQPPGFPPPPIPAQYPMRTPPGQPPQFPQYPGQTPFTGVSTGPPLGSIQPDRMYTDVSEAQPGAAAAPAFQAGTSWQEASVKKPTEEASIEYKDDMKTWAPEKTGKVSLDSSEMERQKIVTEELRRLDELKAKGAIDEFVYRQKRLEILEK